MQKIYSFLIILLCCFITTTCSQSSEALFCDLLVDKSHKNNIFINNELIFFMQSEPQLETTIGSYFSSTIPVKNDTSNSNLFKLISPINTPIFTCYNLIWPYHSTEIGYDLFILCRPCEVCSQHLNNR
jgi:hypothetical protein